MIRKTESDESQFNIRAQEWLSDHFSFSNKILNDDFIIQEILESLI